MNENIPIRVFARHVQLSQRHWAALFGEDTKPTPLLPPSDAQTVCAEVVDITIDDAALTGVRLVLPFCENTKVALLRRDFAAFGASLPDAAFDPCGIACRVEGPKGTVVLADSVEFHPRHLALPDTDESLEAATTNATLRTNSDRPRDFVDVLVRRDATCEQAVLFLDVDDTQSTTLSAETGAHIVRPG